MAATTSLLDLPQELLGHISSFLTPCELTRLGRTCHRALDFIAASNLILWRDAFMREFDDPHERWNELLPTAKEVAVARQKQWNWHVELRRRLSALRAMDVPRSDFFELDHDEIADALLDIIDTAATTVERIRSSGGSQNDSIAIPSKNMTKLCPRTRRSFLMDRLIDTYKAGPSHSLPEPDPSSLSPSRRHYTRSVARNILPPRSDSISRLHVLYGLTNDELENGDRGPARRLTYDWHLTSDASDYGPYRLDGSGQVNWQLLEAVCTIIGRNIQRCVASFLTVPQDLRHSLPYRTLPDPPHDWARVTGLWVGTYSFMDYQDLFHYNVGYAPGPRPSLDDELEACGDLMRLELQLDDRDMIKNDWRLKSDQPVCEDLPVLFFSGTSRGHAGPARPMIEVRGRVSLVPGGREVRWRYLISYGGADQWQLEGVQAGGVRSGGVFGLWSHCDHDDHGPVGPFCYFPLELCEHVR